MQTYELTYILYPELTQEEVKNKETALESIVQKNEGIIIKKSNPTLQTLSYPIKKKSSGFVGILEFQLEPEKITEIKRIIEKDEKIIRYMLVSIHITNKKKRKDTGRIESFLKSDNRQKTIEAKEIKKEKVELKDIEQELDNLLKE